MAKRRSRVPCTWYGFEEDKDGLFSVFDTFDDEAGREAHLNGAIAKALMANADELFSEAPQIHKIRFDCGGISLTASDLLDCDRRRLALSRKTRSRLPPRSLCMSSAE